MSKQSGKRAYWCDICQVPLLGEKCGACGGNGREICSASLVPVFRPEIYLLKKQTQDKLNFLLKEHEIWVSPSNYTYYYQGNAIFRLSATNGKVIFYKHSKQLRSMRRSTKSFLTNLKKANKKYIEAQQYEAENFIRQTVSNHKDKTVLISFSGGKDSTVVSHLVMNALGRSDVLHIFADTTIEFPDTYKYIKEFQQHHPLTPFVQTHSKLNFFKVAETVGPPSRILRWCCTTHKTNPLAQLINSISPGRSVLTFDGVRRTESTRRAAYPRISHDHKISREILASPLIHWCDLQVWLYILYHDLHFNQAYKKGFRRVGCLYCPFNSSWSEKLIRKRYPQKNNKWKSFLSVQAERMQHPAPKKFVENGWRVRAGGRGLDHYKTTIESIPCKLSNDAIMYQVLSGDIHLVSHFLRPLGPQTIIHKDKFNETFLIHDNKTNEILATAEIAYVDQAIRINYILKKYRRLFQQRVEKQLKKLQSCIFCGACAAKCKVKALDSDGNYRVNEEKCISCLSCVKHVCPIVDSLTKKGK